jgi:O-antigen ligase
MIWESDVSRTAFFLVHALLVSIPLLVGLTSLWMWLLFLLVLGSFLVGIYDMQQTRHSLRRNFPLVGRGRWLM